MRIITARDFMHEWGDYKVQKSKKVDNPHTYDPTFKPEFTHVPVELLRPTERIIKSKNDPYVKNLAKEIKKNKVFRTPTVHEHKGLFYTTDGHHRTSAVIHHMGMKTMPVCIQKLNPDSFKAKDIARNHKKYSAIPHDGFE